MNRLSKEQQEEWLPIVDETGVVINKAPRSLCHSGAKLLHPVVHLHIYNQQGDIFLQKRSMSKRLLPGKWDTAVGGHVSFGETIEEALKREASEELGMNHFEFQLIGQYLWESEREKEFVYSFFCKHYDQIQINNDEVDEGRFWSEEEIEKGIQEGTVTPNFSYEYRHLKLSKPRC